MLRILRAMQFLTLLINTAPSRLAEERHALDRALAECSTALTETVVRLCALPGEVASGISPDVIAAKINESLRQQFLQSTIPQTGEALAVVAVQMKRTVAEFQQASTAVNQVHRNVTSETDQAVRRIESSVRSALTASERASKDLTATFLHEYRWSIAMIAAVSLLAGVLFGIAFQNWRMSPLAEEPVPVVKAPVVKPKR